MQIDVIIKMCQDFICDYLRMNPSSPLLQYIYTYEMGISPEEILLKIKYNLESIFSETMEKYVFLRTPFAQLSTIISNRDMRAKDEYVIVKCIVMWVQYDVEDRLQHANSLLELVDCGLCSKSMMLDNKSINTHIPLLDKLLQQLHIQISILNDKSTNDLIKQYSIERIDFKNVPRKVPSKIKSSCKSLCHVSRYGIYDTATNERITQYNFGEVESVIYTTKLLLFIFSFSECKMYKYNIATKDVDVCRYPTIHSFNSPPSINETSDGRLVVIGGWSNGKYNNEMNYYNMTNDSWTKGQCLPRAIGQHETIIYRNEIYVIGGYKHNQLRCYRNGTWQTLSPLLNNRHWHIAILDGNCIYVYGGNRTDSECYDILTDQWSLINNAAYKSINSTNSIIDVDKRLLYTHQDTNVYSISLDNNTKSLLYNNVSCHRLVLMHV